MRKLRPRPDHRSRIPARRFPFKRALISGLAAFSLLSCDPDLPERPAPPKIPPPAMRAPPKKRPVLAPKPRPAMKPAAMKAPEKKKPVAKKKPKPQRPRAECGKFCFLKYEKAASILHKRTTQRRKKMKLTPKQGKRAAAYLINDIPSMPKTKRLLTQMPKTTIELLRGMHERDVPRKDAEALAGYFLRFLKSMKMTNLGAFDECMSHMIGREWHEIDYSGERTTWKKQRKFYNRKRRRSLSWVKNLKKPLYFHRFFKIESKMPYFGKLFQPEGKLPTFK